MSTLSLDHVFICVREPEPAISALSEFGLTMATRRVQPGTGAQHATWYFENAYIELVWASPGAIPFAEEPRLHMAERCKSPSSGWCPFGYSFRASPEEPLPIATWPYSAPFTPAGVPPIPVAINSSARDEPLLLASYGPGRPDALKPRPPMQDRLGLRTISAVRFQLPGAEPSLELARLEELGFFSRTVGPFSVEFELDGGASGARRSFHPAVPLSLSW